MKHVSLWNLSYTKFDEHIMGEVDFISYCCN